MIELLNMYRRQIETCRWSVSLDGPPKCRNFGSLNFSVGDGLCAKQQDDSGGDMHLTFIGFIVHTRQTVECENSNIYLFN